MKHRLTIISLMMVLAVMTVRAQIIIGGNVYGGGNKGNVDGSSSVTVKRGDMKKVFGGARMANVGGNSYVNIDGAHATGYMVIDHVYGGNDISGTIGTAAAVGESLPAELLSNPDHVDNTWNSYVHISTKAENEEKIFIGQAFAGGNGDYKYDPNGTSVTTGTGADAVTKHGYNIYQLPWSEGDPIIATITVKEDECKPELDKTYLDIQGGTIAYGYGGGNNATVRDKAIIHVDNPSMVVVNHVYVNPDTRVEDEDATEESHDGTIDLLSDDRLKYDMGISTAHEHIDSPDFLIGRLFGGNNKADMAIRPTWDLQSGMIRNLYSGGNRGRMIHEQGIFLEINPSPSNTKPLKIDNVFGGCRMADVRPMKRSGTGYVDVENVKGKLDEYDYKFPDNLAARVIVAGGDVNNVYGGNDVRGKVYFGNAVGILTSIRGNVYGGGNGAYAYTDNVALKNDPYYGDFYYDPDEVLAEAGVQATFEQATVGEKSVEALNLIRPIAEQVSLLLRGKDAAHRTIIKGSVYVGGNCATLMNEPRPGGPDMGSLAKAELKIGSYVIADNVFLGNNGEEMVKYNEEVIATGDNPGQKEGVLRTYRRGFTENNPFNHMNLTESDQMKTYMKGVALSQVPRLVVENDKDDRYSYVPYTSYIGSLFYGNNRGSMNYSGQMDINLDTPIYIYNKLVAGCNDANIAKTNYNARYEGGILGNDQEQQEGYMQDDKIRDRVVMNLEGIRLLPKRLNSTKTDLEWNTVTDGQYQAVAAGKLEKGKIYYTSATGTGEFTATGLEDSDGTNYYSFGTTGTYVNTDSGSGTGPAKEEDLARRLIGGHVYGGCYESGHVNGNVVINLNGSLVDRFEVFDEISRKQGDDDEILYDYEKEDYNITKRNSGVILNEQGMDVLGDALTVYGGGKGKETQIWGSATVNLTKGYTFQIFGGSEEGVIGKLEWDVDAKQYKDPDISDEMYSTYVNLNGSLKGVPRSENSTEDMAEAEFIYGGGFSGKILGNVTVHLDNGRLFNLFAGSCNADILGHAETYVGQNGFPYLRDHIYGGNDLGGEIKGFRDFTECVRDKTLHMVHTATSNSKDVLKANTYIEYHNGSMKSIFGGCFGDYDYVNEFKASDGYSIPRMHNAFVNFVPDKDKDYSAQNRVEKVFGAGEGMQGVREGDKMQDRSYVLIDIDDGLKNFANTEVFGAGSNNGLGMRYTASETFGATFDPDGATFDPDEATFDPDSASAIIDLARGQIGAAYGGSYKEGITRRSVVNVPEGSTIKIGSIFGGAYGNDIYEPCDVYEANVNYRTQSEDAYLIYAPQDDPEKNLWKGAIYGGNNSKRRTLYGKVNIDAPVRQQHPEYGMTTATVYGAGYGSSTWSEYTQVNLNKGANVFEVYGGGEAGGVMSAESVQKYIADYKPDNLSADEWEEAWSLGSGYDPQSLSTGYAANQYTNLNNPLVRVAEMDDRSTPTYRYDTNVIIEEGAYVGNYAYGGGKGKSGDVFAGSGDVYGTTYITLLGGRVNKDIYAAGTSGNVYDLFGVGNGFMASANAYIEGGTCRNVYGGGYEGNIGVLSGTGDLTKDFPGETHVVIGKTGSSTFTNGDPAIQRNAYGGGEGGSVFGTANITLYNGHIGYVHLAANEKQDGQGKIVAAGTSENLTERYEEKLNDETYYKSTDYGKEWAGEGTLEDCGNIYGSGYDDVSSVDNANVTLYGGLVRNCVFGGGEVAIVGRGTKASADASPVITKAGQTNVTMYNGHVLQNVYGGGKGYNLQDYGSSNNRFTNGCVFGQTRVNIHGGEIGTEDGVKNSTEIGNVGNVFGGGDAGIVYSAYEYETTVTVGNETQMVTKIGHGKKFGERYDDGDEGYYYKYEDGDYITENGEKVLTEDCKVVVEPWLQVKADNGISFDADGDGTAELYKKGDYIPTAYLNTLPNKTGVTWPSEWNQVEVGTPAQERGVIIYNGVFAGGNKPVGNQLSANAKTIFGNATASIHDVYYRDFITLGTGRVGGLYGDGNLTLVDGYRELNITNYGTDFYHIESEINRSEYDGLFPREQAYYEIRYKCMKDCQDKDGTEYHKANEDKGINASTISAEEMELLFLRDVEEEDGTITKVPVYVNSNGKEVPPGTNGAVAILNYDNDSKEWVPNPDYWSENGLRSRYAGRTMNTIQRADFCGVFGSRMEMLGAEDRVLTQQDHTKYTINRVREVSLNKKTDHGNYFGIYSNVNYLGALTSDFDFGDDDTSNNWTKHGDERTTDNPRDIYQPTAAGQTFFDWKKLYPKDNRRNNGLSHNELALASGVYLELTTEKKEGKGLSLYEKDWGLITGVVQLDLINVNTGVGGGYVYAKNVHGVRKATGLKQTILTSLNKGAATKKEWEYIETNKSLLSPYNAQNVFQTSGNFVHNTQTIIDDCYNIGNKYKLDDSPVPAHYWFIKGSVYVYDQYISAYTGAANAYNEKTEIPLTITAASNGRLTLIDVQPNLYAYYANTQWQKLSGDQKLVINDVTYHLNDTITYWDWSRLGKSEQALFVRETYVNSVACNIDGEWHEAGTYVMNEKEFDTFKEESHTYKDINNYPVYQLVNGEKVEAGTEYVFRSSNNLSHDTGFILTYQVNNPAAWDKWYTLKQDGTDVDWSISKKDYELKTNKDLYWDAPTYTPSKSGLYGQHRYRVGDIISQDIETTYSSIGSANIPNPATTDPDYEKRKQAKFERAWITTEVVDAKKPDPDNINSYKDQHYEKGAKLAASEYYDTSNENATWPAELSGKVAEAWVCTTTIQISEDDFILPAELLTAAEITEAGNTLNNNIKTLLENKVTSITTDRITQIQSMDASALETSTGLTDAEKTALGYNGIKSLMDMLTAKEELTTNIQKAYYCTEEGMYGGNYYVTGKNYRGIDAWCGMTDAEREHFTFNYDALDLLIDPYYSKNADGKSTIHPDGKKYQYDGDPALNPGTSAFNPTSATAEEKALMLYSLQRPVDYTAEFTGQYKKDGDTNPTDIQPENYPTYIDDETHESKQVDKNEKLSPAEFESIPNEQRHYAKINVTDANNEGTDSSPVYKVYVVNNYFNNNDGSYAVGSTFVKEEYERLSSDDKTNVTTLEFTGTGAKGTYYYCRQSYTVGEKGDGNSVTTSRVKVNGTATDPQTYGVNAIVPLGAVIGNNDYTTLTNKQLGFTISGISPTESTTFYVSRDADIRDLSKEKIITVIYQYDYEESDEAGTTITPYSERHILNIHIQFKSGVPTITDIKEPSIVLPGTSVAPEAPKVTPGAYEVIGTGWELFRDPSDADIGYNGKEYNPNNDELYWYQDKYHIAYYADTYLGRTYSNHVPVHVANYHDLKKVMDDKEHHYYIDHKDVAREPKIYINDYTKVDENGVTTAESQNGLDLLKDIIDLSYKTLTYTTDNNGNKVPVPIDDVDSPLNGHVPFEDHTDTGKPMKGGQYLEFFLRTDIDHGPTKEKKTVSGQSVTETVDHPWTPIASGENQCFEGVLHGDGYTISGLAPATGTSGSLFGKLCGSVYNLGVMGSFTGAGVADYGDGYVESCWVKTSATTTGVQPQYAPLAEGMTKPYAVFGVPSDATDATRYQVVNSYFWDGNKDLYSTETNAVTGIITSGGNRGKVVAKSTKDFYTGEVAYDLNNFYLYKRYNDHETTDGASYKYYLPDVTDAETGKLKPQVGYYANNANLCSSGYNSLKYVEDRFADGDFRYAAGVIPTSEDERYYEVKGTDTNGNETVIPGFAPIWPDDYIFFGQRLNFGYDDIYAHQEVPTAVVREGGRLSQNADANRVYRAPAYFRSSKMGVAHFNPNVWLAQKEKLTAAQIAANAQYETNGETEKIVIPREVYPKMTAIDFAGHDNQNVVNGTYTLGTEGTWFYQPLLDDGGLLSITNIDETQNLLVYAPAESGSGYVNAKTHGVLTDYFKEPVFNSFWDRSETQSKYSDGKKYDRVYFVDDLTLETVHGHLVQGNLTSTNDHLLVDRQDFNCPIQYQFVTGNRMWYQRIPDNYVSIDWVDHDGDATTDLVRTTKGWQDISLPFSAEMVSTHQKGEITHFYDKSESSYNETGSKIGHEYWLRGYNGVVDNPSPAPAAGVEVADFEYPTADNSETLLSKTYRNGFLWDYYYNEMTEPHHKDKNSDTYQTYYEPDGKGIVNKYSNYAMLTKAVPYIIGLPSDTYYEFDLSGEWAPSTTFAPNPAKLDKQVITFASSADEGATIRVSDKEMTGAEADGYTFRPSYMNEEFDAGTLTYTLNADGTSYVKVPATGDATKLSAFRPYFTGHRENTRSIVFGNGQLDEMGAEEHGNPLDGETGTLRIWAKKDKIYVESTLSFTEDVRVVTPAGITVASFAVKPGKTVEVKADFSGMYIVHTLDGLYTKKVTVRK